jgi:hypothetical protein
MFAVWVGAVMLPDRTGAAGTDESVSVLLCGLFPFGLVAKIQNV